MRAVVAVKGRFHAFGLARELARRERLAALWTSYPSLLAARWGVPRQLIRGHPAIDLKERYARWRARRRGAPPPTRFARLFHRSLLRLLDEPPGILHVMAGHLGESGPALQRAGWKIVLDRGSLHIEEQDRLLAAIESREGVRIPRPTPEEIACEWAEYALADHVVVLSEASRHSFLERGADRERVHVTGLPVSIGPEPPPVPLDATPTILYCGQIAFQKGIGELLRALALLRDVPLRLRLLGQVDPEIAPRLAAASSDSRLELLPRCRPRAVRAQMEEAHIVVIPSLQDGGPLVVAEALAAGRPLVASDRTAAADLIAGTDAGLLYPADDPEALAAALQALCAEGSALVERGACAREVALKSVGMDRYIDRVVAVHDAAGRRRPSRPAPELTRC